MKCPKCRSEVSSNADYCPNCKMNLSFTTKNKSEYTKIEEGKRIIDNVEQKVNKLKGKIILITFITIISLIAFITFFDFFTIIKGVFFIKRYAKTILIIGVLLLLLWFVLYLLKKKGVILKILFITSLILIVVPFTLGSAIKIEGNGSGFTKNYSREKYIEIGSEKIPSLYSVVGYREIIFNAEEKDDYDEDMKTKMDFISLIYENISEEDITLYVDKLEEVGFSLKLVADDEGIIHNFYTKDKKDNTFYVVTIYDNQITYSKGKGSFEKVINNAL